MSATRFALGLLGWPLTHSLSPMLHGAALHAASLDGGFRCYPVRPGPNAARELDEWIDRMRTGVLHGLNVTVPHKVRILPLLDALTEEARAIGAVNTLFLDAGRVLGDNTDAPGFLADLDSQLAPSPGYALILGAGGAARAVAFALSRRGWRVLVASRRLEHAKEMAGAISNRSYPTVQAIALNAPELQPVIASLTLIVQATPAGSELAEGSAWPDQLPLPSEAMVYDLVYFPRETPLMLAAREAGLRTAGGMGMLVEQAALSFERWTGVRASRQAMRLAVGLAEPAAERSPG